MNRKSLPSKKFVTLTLPRILCVGQYKHGDSSLNNLFNPHFLASPFFNVSNEKPHSEDATKQLMTQIQSYHYILLAQGQQGKVFLYLYNTKTLINKI